MNTAGNISAYRLSNGEAVNAAEIEQRIAGSCHYVKYAIVKSNGTDEVYALIFPDKNQLEHPGYKITPEEGCFCPRNIEELGKCIQGCIAKAMSGGTGVNLKCAAIITSGKNTESAMGDLKSAALAEQVKKFFSDDIPTDSEAFIVKL